MSNRRECAVACPRLAANEVSAGALTSFAANREDVARERITRLTLSTDPPPVARRSFGRSIWPALTLATIVLLARGAMISLHQSERYDDEYHLRRGIAFLRGDLGNRPLNDPPLGEALGALPLFVTGSYDADRAIDTGIYGHHLAPETLLLLVAIWKSALFVPMIAVAFVWTRELYGLAAAWLATAMLLIEPTFAAHVPLPAVDVIGVEGIVIACHAIWRYLARPTLARSLLATAAIAVAMLLKHTALILPGVALLTATAWWIARPLLAGGLASLRAEWRGRVARRAMHAAVALVALPLLIFALSGFDVSKPLRKKRETVEGASVDVIRLLRREWPAGNYVRAVVSGIEHVRRGHASYLNGARSFGGRWDYFPIVASYKLPVGIGAVLLVGVASLAWRRPARRGVVARAADGRLPRDAADDEHQHRIPSLPPRRRVRADARDARDRGSRRPLRGRISGRAARQTIRPRRGRLEGRYFSRASRSRSSKRSASTRTI